MIPEPGDRELGLLQASSRAIGLDVECALCGAGVAEAAATDRNASRTGGGLDGFVRHDLAASLQIEYNDVAARIARTGPIDHDVLWSRGKPAPKVIGK